MGRHRRLKRFIQILILIDKLDFPLLFGVNFAGATNVAIPGRRILIILISNWDTLDFLLDCWQSFLLKLRLYIDQT